MTYTLPPHYHWLRRQTQTYNLGFLHGWTEADFDRACAEMASMRLQAQQDYEAQVAILSTSTPVKPAKRQQSPLWMRPMGTSQMCESGLVLDDASQGIN